MANRELPALPNTESRSMENLDALEASGLHGGRSKMHYREIRTTAGVADAPPTATTVPSHNLHNTEEYPPHEMSSRKESSGLSGGPHHYPLPPSQRTSTTLLPGNFSQKFVVSPRFHEFFYIPKKKDFCVRKNP